MKNKKYIVKGAPVIPSLCGIALAILWYMFFYFVQGEWVFDFNTFAFGEMAGIEIYFTLMKLAVPVLFFIAVLFLAEYDLRWMLGAILVPIALEVSLFIYYFAQSIPDYIFENPIKFIAPFLALILFALTVEKVIPTKWVFVGFCGAAVLVPLILTLCGVGEFTYAQTGYDQEYNVVEIVAYLWSDYLSFALYYLGLGALCVKMREPRESDFAPAVAEKEAPAEEESEDVKDFSEEDFEEEDTEEISVEVFHLDEEPSAEPSEEEPLREE